MLADGHHRCHDGGDLRSPDAEMTNRLRTRRKNKTLAASSANVPSAVVIGTRTEGRFILIACLPMALVLPIDSAPVEEAGTSVNRRLVGSFRRANSLSITCAGLILAK
jgi:hypothetical protein